MNFTFQPAATVILKHTKNLMLLPCNYGNQLIKGTVCVQNFPMPLQQKQKTPQIFSHDWLIFLRDGNERRGLGVDILGHAH